MIWARKGLLALLSLLLFVCLLGGVLATSVNSALSHPAKLESWLKDSKLYDHFVTNAIMQARQSASKDTGTSGVSLNDPAVQQAVQSAFPPQLLQQSVNTFMDSNYAWLEGKTNKPDFVIDLTGARQSFALNVGKYAATRLSGLPACSALQQAQLQNPNNIDTLSIACRPPGLSPALASAQVTKKIIASDNFLSKPVITAQTIDPNSDKSGTQPYYVRLAKAPRVYRLGQKLPLVLGILGLVSMLGIILIAPARRKGVLCVGGVLLTVGLLLVATTFVAGIVSKRVEQRIFNNAGVGLIQQSLVDFAHRVQHQIVSVNLYFGIAFIVVAAIIFIYLLATKHPRGKPQSALATASPNKAGESTSDGVRGIQLAPRPRPRAVDIIPPKSKPTGPPPLKAIAANKSGKSSRPRGPRLIQ